MRGGPKTLIVALAALLLAVGLVACGGDSSDSPTSETEAQSGAASKPSEGSSQQSDAKAVKQGKSSGDAKSNSPNASDFVPKHHNDSGGGSEQFRVKGGDNSIQEFGEEAEASEFDAAAAVLHDFLDARAEGNWAAACRYMSKSVTESFEKAATGAKLTSCKAILEALINPAAKGLMKAEAEKASVGSLRTEGEQAFVIYTGTDGTALAMPMANEGGDWKVASLAGTPLE